MRTRTKYVIVAGVWVGVLVSIVVIGNVFLERGNAAAIIMALLGCGVLQWIAHVAGVVKENVSEVNRKKVDDHCGNQGKS